MTDEELNEYADRLASIMTDITASESEAFDLADRVSSILWTVLDMDRVRND